jgi:pimeloyl-ACP methyl ester carboxylesterase
MQNGTGMNVRIYGDAPYKTAVLHGGPGAPGYMAPVARELAQTIGVIEPLQTKDSLDGQIEELQRQLTAHADIPVALIGSSWGAVLALFVASRAPELVRKLILIGSAVFDAENSSRIENIRMARLDDQRRRRYAEIMSEMETASARDRQRLMSEWGEMLFDADVYDPLTVDLEIIEVQHDVFAKVWSDFVVLRDRPGYLNEEFSKIKASAVVIHGEYDPHPIEGIRPFLEHCMSGVRFYMLPRCGHYPWIERNARDTFFEILRNEI